ncbi:MAG: IS66 family transposase, partial [Sandaracinaceae bacterium]|nr:IS66 family transposase [Sandaracinaceae bacterium]
MTSARTPDIVAVREQLWKMIRELSFALLVSSVLALLVRMRDLNLQLMKQLGELRRGRPPSEKLKRLQRQLMIPFGETERAINEARVAAANDEDRRTSDKAGPAVDDASSSAPQEPSTEETPAAPKKSRVGRHPGRAMLPAHLPRVPVENPVPPELRICPLCGVEMTTLGHTPCEILDIVPAHFVVKVRLDETVACPKDDTIVSAEPPPQIIERGKLGTTLLVESTCDKFIEHQPIERQCLRMERAGVPVAPQTLGRGVTAVIDLVSPLATLIAEQTRGPGVISMDASGIRVLDRDAPDGIRNGTMWCWINDSWITYSYAPSGDAESVRDFLGDDLARDIQCDGTTVTNLIEREGGRRPGCWSHGRRRFAEAARGGDRLALDLLKLVSPLFAVEREARRAGDTPDQRLERRRLCSVPIVARIRAWIDEHRGEIPPKTPLGRALGYMHRQWARLILFLEDGRIELTNNHVERALRKLVLGRKNWLFTWGDLGGERVATILTIIATCVAHGVDPRGYLHEVVRRLLAGWKQSQLAELLPNRLVESCPHLRVRAPIGTALPAAPSPPAVAA